MAKLLEDPSRRNPPRGIPKANGHHGSPARCRHRCVAQPYQRASARNSTCDRRYRAAVGLFFSMNPRFWLNLQTEVRHADCDARADSKDRASCSRVPRGRSLSAQGGDLNLDRPGHTRKPAVKHRRGGGARPPPLDAADTSRIARWISSKNHRDGYVADSAARHRAWRVSAVTVWSAEGNDAKQRDAVPVSPSSGVVHAQREGNEAAIPRHGRAAPLRILI